MTDSRNVEGGNGPGAAGNVPISNVAEGVQRQPLRLVPEPELRYVSEILIVVARHQEDRGWRAD